MFRITCGLMGVAAALTSAVYALTVPDPGMIPVTGLAAAAICAAATMLMEDTDGHSG